MTDTGHHREIGLLTEDEVRLLLAQCSRRAPTGIRDRAVLVVMYRAGLRVSEALDLRPADIDHDRGTIRVHHGKGDKARTVGIDAEGLAVIQLWISERAKLGINGRSKLFCTLKGTPLSANQVRQMIKRRAAKTDISKRVHPHGLRHTHAAELIEEGVPLNVIRDQLGHTSIATTDTYLRNIAPDAVIKMGRNRKWSAD
jgi:site-specific recombinase XerD